LKAIVLYDRDPVGLETYPEFEHLIWSRREIENYVLNEEALIQFAQEFVKENVPEVTGDAARRLMQNYIEESIPEGAPRRFDDPRWKDIKVSDEFLCILFSKFFEVVAPGFYARSHKAIFAEIVEFMPVESIDEEVTHVLDRILMTAID
jgi:hypothetical protein